MMEQQSDNREFTTHYSPEALAARRDLPKRARYALMQIEDEVFEDATGFLNRSRPHSRDKKILLYSHADPPLIITYELDRDERVISILHLAAPQFDEKRPLFISYAHEDDEWRESLLKWLTGIDRELINEWHDKQIDPGARWRDEIDAALRSAKAAVLLVTQDFLASKFVTEVELPALLDAAERGELRLLWIAVKRSRYDQTPLAEIKALNDPEKPLFALRGDNRDNAFREISELIEKAVSGSAAAATAGSTRTARP